MLLTVAPEEDGRILKNLLQSRYKISRRLLRHLVRENGIRRQGEVIYLSQRVHQDDVISIMLPNETSELQIMPMKLDIRYEDTEILVVNKPAGVLSHPTAWEREDSMLSGLLHYLKPEQRIPHCVHRLDRETSGLVMFAKHAHYHHVFDYALQQGLIHRSYTAFVHVPHEYGVTGHHDSDVDTWRTIELPIAVNRNKPSRRVISMDGQAAVTHYRFVLKHNDVALIQLKLETGRTHQIRLHMASVGLPIIGDPHYDWSYCMLPGGRERARSIEAFSELSRFIGHQALHAFRLQWTHPVTKLHGSATAPPPEDMRSVAAMHGITNDQWQQATQRLFSINSPG